jgi:tripartite ATP-independent transporter DctM subunit
METAGLWMLAAVALVMIATGVPAWVSLVAVAAAFAAIGSAAGVFTPRIFGALQARIVGLLDNDLLQALPLYVLMGSLIDRLPLAGILFRSGSHALEATRCGKPLAGLGLGVLLAPMSGSVGASVAMLGRIVQPRLEAGSASSERSLALVCASATLGVLIPPSLVLILFGDAMLRAHTEAANVVGLAGRIVNTQDIFHGALVPGALLVGLSAIATWFSFRGERPAPAETPRRGERVTALLAVAAIGGLLASVALGYLYAVEAAATGGVALFAYGIATGTLRRGVLAATLRDTLALTGALFALLVAATFFTLVQRAFGTDRWLAEMLARLDLGAASTLAIGLIALGTCALVLDAFEMIFVVVPLLMPAMLTRVPDATWTAVLTLLVLQASFLIPPFGYAVLMARSRSPRPVAAAPLARALAPYVAAQLAVLGLVLAFPQMLWRDASLQPRAADSPASDAKARELLERQLAPPQ